RYLPSVPTRRSSDRLDGAVDVPWEPEAGETVVERGHFLVDQDFPIGVVDDADVDVLVGQLTATGGQGVVEAFVGLIDVGGHGQVEVALGQWEGDLLLGVGQKQLVRTHGS